MARRGGNSDNPFSTDGEGGIDWSGQQNDPSGFKPNGSGSSPKDGWGSDAATGVNWLDKAENKRPDRESKYSNEKTVLDRSRWPSDARVRRTSAQQYSSNSYKDDTK
jgi:hypothetical protein